jgi:hypothetical protein
MYHPIRHYVKVISYFLMLLCIIGFSLSEATWALDNENSAVARKELWLGDFDNGRIWVMDLDKRTVLTSYPAPSLEPSPLPTGMALLRGRLYVNNFNFNFDCHNGNELFSINKKTGKVFGVSVIPACAIDGMAAIPEAGLVVGIDSRVSPEQLVLLKPIPESGDGVVVKVGTIVIDVPGGSVRGLAYLNGKLYVSEEDTDSIYIYHLNLPSRKVTLKGQIDIGTKAPGLAMYGSNLIAYDIVNHQLLIVEAKPGGAILEKIPLTGTGIGHVASLETKVVSDAYYDDAYDYEDGTDQ